MAKRRRRKTMPVNDNYVGYMATDLKSYLGEWVAICNGKVISHDSSFKKAYAEARKQCPNKRPLLTRVPDQDTMIF
jgi:hypothetical protein